MHKNHPNFNEITYPGEPLFGMESNVYYIGTKSLHPYRAHSGEYYGCIEQQLPITITQVTDKPGHNIDQRGQDDPKKLIENAVAGGQPVIFRTMPFSDDNAARKEGRLTDAYLAEQTGGVVVSINSPGINFSGDKDQRALSELTPEQKTDLRLGSYRAIGKAFMNIINQTIPSDTNSEIIVVGSSMGAASASATVNAMATEGHAVHSLYLLEPANIEERNPLKLALEFFGSNKDAGGYIKSNPQDLQDATEGMSPWLRRLFSDAKANFSYFLTMTKGGLIDDLTRDGAIDKLREQGTRILVERGAGSPLCTGNMLGRLATYLAPLGEKAQTSTLGTPKENPHSHGVQMSVVAVSSGINRARNL